MQPLIPIGYFPKRIARRPDWLRAAHVAEIRSVCECISSGPEDWIQHWTHNKLWVYSTIAAALAVVPETQLDEFELHFYRMLPLKWDEGTEGTFLIPPLDVEPMPDDFQSVGFDAVSIEVSTSGFDHSPLFCNRMAEEIKTNEHCLLDDLETAKRTALRFSKGLVEPGPYHVVEVLAQLRPG